MDASKKFYALSDTRTGDYPKEYTEGFANAKEVIFFTSAILRDKWLEETKLLTARALTRNEALRYSVRSFTGDRMARPVQHPDKEFVGYYEIIRESRSQF